jgi:hypothetical protein
VELEVAVALCAFPNMGIEAVWHTDPPRIYREPSFAKMTLRSASMSDGRLVVYENLMDAYATGHSFSQWASRLYTK